jgi:hypothetical protein
VRHGTSSSISLGASCPSDCANGPTGSDQWDFVLPALAILDRDTQMLFLARDRMSIKLYASEAKAFLCHPAYEFALDHGRLSEVFLFRYVAGTCSIGISRADSSEITRCPPNGRDTRHIHSS